MSLQGKQPDLTWNANANSGEKNHKGAELQSGGKPLRPAGEKQQHPRSPLLTLPEAEKSREVSLRHPPPQTETHFSVT